MIGVYIPNLYSQGIKTAKTLLDGGRKSMEYIKKALKTATTNTPEIRTIVKGILSEIKAGAETTVYELARKFDNWEGDFILNEVKK